MQSTNNIKVTAVGTPTSVFTVQSLATYSEKKKSWRCEQGFIVRVVARKERKHGWQRRKSMHYTTRRTSFHYRSSRSANEEA